MENHRFGRFGRARLPAWFLTLLLGFGAALGGSAFLPRASIEPSEADRHALYWLEVDPEGASPVSLERDEVEYRAYLPCPRFRIRNQQIPREEASKVGVILRVTNLNRDVVEPVGTFSWERWETPTTFAALVEVQANEEAVVEFRDAHPDRPARFFVAGDPELNFPVLDRFLAAARRERPAFVWIAGDLIQEQAWLCEEYLERFAAAEVPVYVAIGNHDLTGDRGDPPYEARKEAFRHAFGPLHHAFEFRGVRYVVLDTSAPYVPREQLDWLEATLAQDPERRTILMTHKPFADPRPGSTHAIEDPWDAERLAGIVSRAPGLVYYCGHIEGYYVYEAAGVPVRIAGSLTRGNLLERDEGGANGYLVVTLDGEEWEEERVELEPAGGALEIWGFASVLGPAYLEQRPEVGIGSALVLLSLGMLLRRWRRGPKS